MPWIDKDLVYFPYQRYFKSPLNKKKKEQKPPQTWKINPKIVIDDISQNEKTEISVQKSYLFKSKVFIII